MLAPVAQAGASPSECMAGAWNGEKREEFRRWSTSALPFQGKILVAGDALPLRWPQEARWCPSDAEDT